MYNTFPKSLYKAQAVAGEAGVSISVANVHSKYLGE